MQLITFGVLFVATALAYPLAENSEQNQPLIPDSVEKIQRDTSSASAETSSEESSEDPKLATTEASSEESTRTELPTPTSPPLTKREEPKLDEAKKIEEPKKIEEVKKIEEAKPIEGLAKTEPKKIEETPAGDAKTNAQPSLPDVVVLAKNAPAIAEESDTKPAIPPAPLEVSTEKIEKPLALPTLEGKKDDLAPAPSEKKEERVALSTETPASSTAAAAASTTTLKDAGKLEEKKIEVIPAPEKTKREEPLATPTTQKTEEKKLEEPVAAPAAIPKKEETLKKSESDIPEKLPEPSASS